MGNRTGSLRVVHSLRQRCLSRADLVSMPQETTVLDAAARLLAVDPRASTEEIARSAGISRATLHRLFTGEMHC